MRKMQTGQIAKKLNRELKETLCSKLVFLMNIMKVLIHLLSGFEEKGTLMEKKTITIKHKKQH